MAARVMRGESPAGMPFEPVEKTQFIINLDNAKQIGLAIPQKLIDQADKVIRQ